MNEQLPQAINVAVAVYKQPNQFVIPRPGRYPKCMLDVIKSAAGDEATIRAISDDLKLPNDAIVSICKFYLQKLITSSGSDPFLMLALDRNASAADIKDHKRWLLKWLHPDRNSSKWESALFSMIGNATLQLERGNFNQQPLALIAPIADRKQRSRHRSWRHAKMRKRRNIIFKLFKPLLLAIGIGLIFTFVVSSAVSNWTLIKQAFQN